MKYRYVVVDDIQKGEPQIFKGFVSALRVAKKLPKSYIYEYKWDPAEGSSKDHWRCIWNWADQWDDDTAIGLVLQRQYKEVANDADQIDDNYASDAFENMIREDFELNIKKTPDKVEISTSGDEAGEVFDFTRAILGDNFEAFDQDFPAPVENEVTDLAPAEFDYEFDDDQVANDHEVDPDAAFSDIEFAAPRTEDEIDDEESDTEVTDLAPVSQPEDKEDDTVEDDEVVEPKDVVPAAEKALMDTIEQTPADESPKDMINGKLVDAKNPTESEVEIEEEDSSKKKSITESYDFETDDYSIYEIDHEFYSGTDPEHHWVDLGIYAEKADETFVIELTGPTAKDVEVTEVGEETENDPADYPSDLACYAHPYTYYTVEEAELDADVSDLNYKFLDEDYNPITEEHAKEALGLSESDYQTFINKVLEIGLHVFIDAALEYAYDSDNWDELLAEYDDYYESYDCNPMNKHLSESANTDLKEWTCWYEGKDIGTVFASTQEEAEQEMMNTYPHFYYNNADCGVTLADEDVDEDYTGTPEERTTHLEYTDKDVTDGKAVLPKNITKAEDDHCTKINKGINHDVDPKEKALLEEVNWIDLAEKLLSDLIKECDATNYSNQEAYESNNAAGKDIYWIVYTYTEPFKDFAKVKELCKTYSELVPKIAFSTEDYRGKNSLEGYIGCEIDATVLSENYKKSLTKKKNSLLEMANFSAEDKYKSELLDKYYSLKDPSSPSLQAWVDADWDTKVDLADELLDKLVTECDETDYNDQDGYWVDDHETWCNRYLYYDPFKDSTKVEKLCDKYSARYPGLNFYCSDYEDYRDEQDPDDPEYDDDDWGDWTPAEIGYNLWEAYAGEEDAYLSP